jgi:hypothetical protein
VQILKELQPALLPLIAGKEAAPGRCAEARREDLGVGTVAPRGQTSPSGAEDAGSSKRS